MLQTKKIKYQDSGVNLEGFYACRQDTDSNRPLVIIAHDWTGRNSFACQKAERLAELGYVGFAIDMYGDAKLGKTKEEKSNLIQPFVHDRSLLLQRLMAGLTAAKTLPHVDTHKTAAIGFCFGGLCVLDLARSGIDISGVVSFHGLLNAPENLTKPDIKAKVLALHGYDDPMVSPQQVMQFCDEMTARKANWELTMYGNTVHAFTNPEANDPDFGTVYNHLADSRSWIAMKNFFTEIFG